MTNWYTQNPLAATSTYVSIIVGVSIAAGSGRRIEPTSQKRDVGHPAARLKNRKARRRPNCRQLDRRKGQKMTKPMHALSASVVVAFCTLCSRAHELWLNHLELF